MRERSPSIATFASKLGFDAALQIGDVILVTKNDYSAPTPNDGETVAIYNGERCIIAERRSDTFDGFFPGGPGRASRTVRFIHNGESPPETRPTLTMWRPDRASRPNSRLHSGAIGRSMSGICQKIEDPSSYWALMQPCASDAALSKLNTDPPPNGSISASMSMTRHLAPSYSTVAANFCRAKLCDGAHDAASSSSCRTGRAA